MRHIGLLIPPAALGTSLTIPLEMLHAARSVATAQRVRDSEVQLDTLGTAPGPVTLTGGLNTMPSKRLHTRYHYDLVFIPALWRNPWPQVRRDPKVLNWLRTQHDQGAALCSIGTGSYFLAEAGLLTGRQATTHWYYFDDFEGHYPEVKLQRKRFITHDGRLYCTGSVNAARDVMLHLIEQLWNSDIADQVARHFTHEVRRSYESLLLNQTGQESHHDELIIEVQAWMREAYAQPMPLTTVAHRFQLSLRSLNRRFRAATNTTPLAYLQEIRVENARALLKNSNFSIAEVAFRVGYQDVSHFTALFRRQHGVTPQEYRRLVRTKQFRVDQSDE